MGSDVKFIIICIGYLYDLIFAALDDITVVAMIFSVGRILTFSLISQGLGAFRMKGWLFRINNLHGQQIGL